MAANGAHNLISASVGATESFVEKALVGVGPFWCLYRGRSLTCSQVTRCRSASLPAVVSRAILYAGPVLGLPPRSISFSSGGTQFVAASALYEYSFGGFGGGSFVGLAGGISSGLAAHAFEGTSTTVSGEEPASDCDSVDSGDLRFAGIVNENDSDVEDWDADNHIDKKQRRLD